MVHWCVWVLGSAPPHVGGTFPGALSYFRLGSAHLWVWLFLEHWSSSSVKLNMYVCLYGCSSTAHKWNTHDSMSRVPGDSCAVFHPGETHTSGKAGTGGGSCSRSFDVFTLFDCCSFKLYSFTAAAARLALALLISSYHHHHHRHHHQLPPSHCQLKFLAKSIPRNLALNFAR